MSGKRTRSTIKAEKTNEFEENAVDTVSMPKNTCSTVRFYHHRFFNFNQLIRDYNAKILQKQEKNAAVTLHCNDEFDEIVSLMNTLQDNRDSLPSEAIRTIADNYGSPAMEEV